MPSRSPLKPDRPSRESRTESEGLDPPSGHAVVTEPPLQRNCGGPTSPAVKTSSPFLPPRGADRAVGGIRAEVENSGRRASATNDSTPIPTIRPKSQQFVLTATLRRRAGPVPTGPTDPGIRSAALWRVGRSGCCRGGAVLPVDGRIFRGLITGPDLRTTSPERSRVGCSGVMQKTCHQQPHLVAIQLCSASTPPRLLGALGALTLLLSKRRRSAGGRPGFAARGLRPHALGHHAAETCIHLTTQLVHDRVAIRGLRGKRAGRSRPDPPVQDRQGLARPIWR